MGDDQRAVEEITARIYLWLPIQSPLPLFDRPDVLRMPAALAGFMTTTAPPGREKHARLLPETQLLKIRRCRPVGRVTPRYVGILVEARNPCLLRSKNGISRTRPARRRTSFDTQTRQALLCCYANADSRGPPCLSCHPGSVMNRFKEVLGPASLLFSPNPARPLWSSTWPIA